MYPLSSISCNWAIEFLKPNARVKDFCFPMKWYCAFIPSFQVIVGTLKLDSPIHILEIPNWIIGYINDVPALSYLQT